MKIRKKERMENISFKLKLNLTKSKKQNYKKSKQLLIFVAMFDTIKLQRTEKLKEFYSNFKF